MTFKERVQEELKKQGLTQTDLAERLNVTRQNINNLLRKDNPSEETYTKIAKALDISPSELMGQSEAEKELDEILIEIKEIRDDLKIYMQYLKVQTEKSRLFDMIMEKYKINDEHPLPYEVDAPIKILTKIEELREQGFSHTSPEVEDQFKKLEVLQDKGKKYTEKMAALRNSNKK